MSLSVKREALARIHGRYQLAVAHRRFGWHYFDSA